MTVYRSLALVIAVLCLGSTGVLADSPGNGDGSGSCSGRSYTGGSWNGNALVGSFWGAGLSLNEAFETSVTCPSQPPCGGNRGCSNSPILVPTKKLLKQGRGAEVSGPDRTVLFDIDGDGAPDRVTWPEDGTAFLAIDTNNNGIIDDGTELFGTAGNYSSGFDKLLKLSGSPRGYLDDRDPLFDKLLLWHDNNRDGFTQPSELKKLKNYVVKIGLGCEVVPDVDQHGNQFRWKGWAEYRLGMPADPMDDNRDIYPLFDVNFVRVL